MTELRRRMNEDMQLRNYSERTRRSYIEAVKGLAKIYMMSPDELSEEEVRDFFLHLINARKSVCFRQACTVAGRGGRSRPGTARGGA
jgi:integrase/recombinase XerD